MDRASYSAGVAFRKLRSAVDEMFDCLAETRAAAAKAYQHGMPFDWQTAAEKLEMLDGGLSFYLEPVKPALRKTTPGKMLTVAEVDGKTALHVLQKLSSNTIRAFWIFLNMTDKGTKKLVIPRQQRAVHEDAGLSATITAMSRSEIRELRKHLEREIDDAHEAAVADESRHPGEVARSKYGGDMLPRYWSDIGYQPAANDKQQPRTRRRGLTVERVQGSERSFKIDRKPVTLSPACTNLLNGFIALIESGDPATPANLMAKLSPRYDKNRKRFEDDKGRFNDALEAARIPKGLYVVRDVFELCKPPKKTAAKGTKKNGKKTVRRR